MKEQMAGSLGHGRRFILSLAVLSAAIGTAFASECNGWGASTVSAGMEAGPPPGGGPTPCYHWRIAIMKVSTSKDGCSMDSPPPATAIPEVHVTGTYSQWGLDFYSTEEELPPGSGVWVGTKYLDVWDCPPHPGSSVTVTISAPPPCAGTRTLTRVQQ